MRARGLVAILVAIWLVSALCAAPALAQTAPDANQRLELSGAFISANEMVSALSSHCPGDYGDAPYGANGALIKLHAFVRADEFATLSDYVRSDTYATDRRYIQDKVNRALSNIRINENAVAACRTLASTVLKSYDDAKAALEGLR